MNVFYFFPQVISFYLLISRGCMKINSTCYDVFIEKSTVYQIVCIMWIIGAKKTNVTFLKKLRYDFF